MENSVRAIDTNWVGAACVGPYWSMSLLESSES
jgi:hypothetical protein